MKKTLIIGSEGRIGKRLFWEYKKEYPKLFVTSYNATNINQRLNLLDPDLSILEKNIDDSYLYGIIAAGITDVAFCEKNKEYAFKCNVDGVLKIAKFLYDSNIIPIVFYSDYVFD